MGRGAGWTAAPTRRCRCGLYVRGFDQGQAAVPAGAAAAVLLRCFEVGGRHPAPPGGGGGFRGGQVPLGCLRQAKCRSAAEAFPAEAFPAAFRRQALRLGVRRRSWWPWLLRLLQLLDNRSEAFVKVIAVCLAVLHGESARERRLPPRSGGLWCGLPAFYVSARNQLTMRWFGICKTA